MPQAAALNGWDYPPLQRIFQGDHHRTRYLGGRREGILDAALQALLPKRTILPVAPAVSSGTQRIARVAAPGT